MIADPRELIARAHHTAVMHMPQIFFPDGMDRPYPCRVTEISEAEDLEMEGYMAEIDCVVHFSVRSLGQFRLRVGDKGRVGTRLVKVDQIVDTPDGVEHRALCKDISG